MTTKLEGKQVADLLTLLNLANRCDMESLIIVDGMARAVNKSKTCVILTEPGNTLGKYNMGVGRLGALLDRLSAFSGKSDVAVKLNTNDRGEVSSLDISAGRNKVQYRCTSLTFMESSVPKRVPDSETAAVIFNLISSDVDEITNATRIMKSKLVTLTCNGNGEVKVIAADESNDQFVVNLASAANVIDDDQIAAASYDVGILVRLLKEMAAGETSDIKLYQGAKGTLTGVVDGQRVTLLPQINTDEDD